MKKQPIETIEHRLRETLKRRGYRLEKSRRRDPHALTYGRYWVIWEKHEANYAGFVISATEGDAERDYTMTLAEVNAWCASGKPLPAVESFPIMVSELAFQAYWSERHGTPPEQEAAKPAPTAKETRKATKRPRSGRG
jgi:hypothetical protein